MQQKQLPAKGHMTYSQAPVVHEKNIFYLFCFTQLVKKIYLFAYSLQ